MEEWRGGGGGGGGNTSSTIDIKFNYPQTSANHYFVQQSQLLPFKRFQSIQRRRRGEGEGGASNLRPFHLHARSLHPSIHPSIHPPTFSLLFVVLERRIRGSIVARVSGRGLLPISFSQTPEQSEEGRGEFGPSLLCSRFQSVSNACVASIVPSTDLFFFPPPLLLLSPPPILSTTNDISHGVEVSTVFFFFSLPTLWKIGGGGGRKNGDRSLCERIFQFTKILLVCFFEMDIKVI